MSETIYINSGDQHNKFWSYEIEGTTAHIKWGRIGGSSQAQTKTFSSVSEVNAFISKKTREKEKKGYKKETKEKLKKEAKTAQALGQQNKIKRMIWASKSGSDLSQIDVYDPKQYVYVEILNSWTKQMTRLVLSKEKTWMVQGNITEIGRDIHCDKLIELGYSTFATAVRSVLKEMAEVIAAALKTVKFAASGVRNLFDDEDFTQPASEVQDALSAVDTSGFDSSVVHTFAAMGARSLEL